MPAEAVIDSPTRTSARLTASWGVVAVAQLLPDAEDEEQPVVGAGAEHQHDQQHLRDRRDLQTVPAPSAPISRMEISSASALGSSVTIAAGSDRNTTSNRTMMKRNENVCDLLAGLVRARLVGDAVAT